MRIVVNEVLPLSFFQGPPYFSGNATVTRNEQNAYKRRLNKSKTPSAPDTALAAEVLSEIRDLLEEYGPSWYSDTQRERVEAALRLIRKS